MIKSFEGCRLSAYKALSTEEYYTIGWGHYGPDVTAGMTITQEQADAMLESDLRVYVSYVNTFLNKYNISINQNQFDALCSFTYNLGNVWASSQYPTFQLKTYLINGVNNYSDSDIRTAFTNWNKSGGNVISGLTRRRNAEADLFLGSSQSELCNCSTSYAGNYTCTTSSMNLSIRSGHGSNYSKVGSIPSGATVYVSKASGTGAGNWAHVEYNGVSGFASMEYLTKQDTGHEPFGNVDSAEGGMQSVTVRGWALDEDDYGTALGIHVYIDDICIGTTVADKYRPDVNNVYGCGDYHGYEATFSVDSSMAGEHTLRVYAMNTGGGNTNPVIGTETVNIQRDTEAPVISDYKVIDVIATGYTVSCKVTDNVGVDRVQFPTWTQKDGQDDIIADWGHDSAASGSRNGDTYTYQVNISDHNNERGLYNTHIYAYDKNGNVSSVGINSIELLSLPDISSELKDDFYAKVKNSYTGTALTWRDLDADGKRNVEFTEDQGQREAVWHFVRNQGEDTYTIYCEGNEALVLDVSGGKDYDKNNVSVWTPNGSNAQKWYILGTEGAYYLQPACSQTRVLDTPGGNGGTQNAQIYSYNTGEGVGMNFEKIDPTSKELSETNRVASGNYNGHYYQVFDQSMSWTDAKRACEELGGHLVSITDADEQAFIESLLEKGSKNQYWIGSYMYENSFRWITGETSDYSNWDKRQPDGFDSDGNREYCGQILNKANPKAAESVRFKWNDVNNSNTLTGEEEFFDTEKVGVICEFESLKTFTLSYDANGGSTAPEKEQGTEGTISTKTPVRKGYTFKGWAKEADAEEAEYQPGDKYVLNENMTMYAVWEKLEATGTCGEKASWELNKSGTLRIYGEGAMQNYSYKSEMPWYKYISQIKSIVIEEGVTSIGDYAFYGMMDTTEITIPEGVTTIGAYAFKNSTKLVDVKLPSTLKKLGESAFYGCSSLKSISIPEGIYTIWAYTFKNCTSFEEVNLPESLIKIDEAAFYGCSSLKKIEIPAETSIIGIYCFKNCSNLSEISLPKSMTRIREAAFYGTAITEITIPDNVTSIGSYAFKNCTKLKNVQLSKELKTIGESAFYACENMTKLMLPSKVTTIGNYAFRRCTELQVAEFSEELKSIGESAFYGCSGLSELELPEGTTEVGAYAFKNCTNVINVSLPSTLNLIGDSAFYECDRIESITIPESVNRIGNYAFSRCTGLRTVTFKGGAPVMGDYTFAKVKANVYYPGENMAWTQDKLKNYGGTLTWKKN